MKNKLTRFSGRAGYYARYRPGYPDTVIRILEKHAGWTRDAVVADIGAGTGISSELFLRRGNTVWAVEPNADMRAECAGLQARYPRLELVDGVAEATTLHNASCDFVVAGTALHWFDIERCRLEFRRILRVGGKVALIWNLHRTPETPFVQAFERLSARFGTTYKHRWDRERHNISSSTAKLFGGPKHFKTRYLDNAEQLDFESVKGRLLSASYVPLPGEEGFESMMGELEGVFDQYAVDGRVEMRYQTAVYWGSLPSV